MISNITLQIQDVKSKQFGNGYCVWQTYMYTIFLFVILMFHDYILNFTNRELNFPFYIHQ